MRCIGTDQPWLARWRLGEQIAAHITRRQATGAQTREHQMGEVLAHAPTPLQHFHQRRRDLSGLFIEGEFLENLLHQGLYTQ